MAFDTPTEKKLIEPRSPRTDPSRWFGFMSLSLLGTSYLLIAYIWINAWQKGYLPTSENLHHFEQTGAGPWSTIPEQKYLLLIATAALIFSVVPAFVATCIRTNRYSLIVLGTAALSATLFAVSHRWLIG